MTIEFLTRVMREKPEPDAHIVAKMFFLAFMVAVGFLISALFFNL